MFGWVWNKNLFSELAALGGVFVVVVRMCLFEGLVHSILLMCKVVMIRKNVLGNIWSVMRRCRRQKSKPARL
jgi:hypothetical protein